MSGKLLWVSKLLVVCLIVVESCSKGTPTVETKKDLPVFENGDLIYRHGNGLFSDYFREMSLNEKLYSHTGIISIRNDSTFVIHSVASEFTGIGCVQEEHISTFLYDINAWAVYRLDTTMTIRNRIAECAIEYLRLKTPFDLAIDNTSDAELYCSELVAVSVNKALKSDFIVASGNLRGKPYYSVDDTYLLSQMRLVVRQQ